MLMESKDGPLVPHQEAEKDQKSLMTRLTQLTDFIVAEKVFEKKQLKTLVSTVNKPDLIWDKVDVTRW